MFLEKYLNSTYIDLIYDNYEEDYLNSLDENNFNKIYSLLKKYDFYFIQDIILNYLELFELDEKYVETAIKEVKNSLGDNFVKQIGQNMRLIDKIIKLAILYNETERE